MNVNFGTKHQFEIMWAHSACTVILLVIHKRHYSSAPFILGWSIPINRYVRAHINTARGEDTPDQLSDANQKLAYMKRTEPWTGGQATPGQKQDLGHAEPVSHSDGKKPFRVEFGWIKVQCLQLDRPTIAFITTRMCEGMSAWPGSGVNVTCSFQSH